MSVNSNIAKVRKEKGFSRNALSERTGISAQTLIRYEKDGNNIPIGSLNRIAEALEVDVYQLMGIDKQTFEDNTKKAMQYKTDCASRLEELRIWLDLTHDDFAKLLSVSNTQVRNYQKGRRPIPKSVIERASGGNKQILAFLLGDPDITLNDIDLQTLKYNDNSILQIFSTRELLAEIERRCRVE